MKNKEEEDKSSHFSSAKTSTSLTNEDLDIFPKSRPRGGIKSKINNYQPGRHTITVPLNSFSGISHNASFQSKLLFFNGGKTKPKIQHAPLAHDKVIIEENDKKENKNKKAIINKEDKNQKLKNDKIDLDSNININKIMEQKNNNNNFNKKNNNNDSDFRHTFVKKNSVNFTSSQLHSLLLDPETQNNSDKKQASLNIKLKSLKDQWYYQKILLDYNILDFTSKYILNIKLVLI